MLAHPGAGGPGAASKGFGPGPGTLGEQSGTGTLTIVYLGKLLGSCLLFRFSAAYFVLCHNNTAGHNPRWAQQLVGSDSRTHSVQLGGHRAE